MEWNNDNILRFIELYKEAPVLWCSKHPNHYNRNTKQRAWELIASQLGTSAGECKKKIMSLLSSLRRERMRVKKSRIASVNGSRNGVYKSSWFAYKSFLFLLKYNSHKRNADDTFTDLDAIKPDITTEDNLLDDDCQNAVTENAEIEPEISPELEVPKKKRKTAETTTPRRLPTITSVTTVQTDKAIEDECSAYGRFIAEKLKSYTPQVRSCVQHAISNVLFNADRGLYQENYGGAQQNMSTSFHNSAADTVSLPPQQQGRYVFVPVDGYESSTLEQNQNPLDSISEVTADNNAQLLKTEMNHLR